MCKRLLCFFLGAALIVVLSVPVSAAETYNPWIEISDVCTVNNSGSNYFAFNDKITVTLDPGFSTIVNQIDMIWFFGYGAPNSIYLWRNNSASARLKLTIQPIGGAYYRVYGNVGNYTLSQYKFDIDCGTGAGYRSYELKSLRVAESVAIYDVDYTDSLVDESDYVVTESGFMLPAYVALERGMVLPYTWQIELKDWKSYDYVDLMLSTRGASIGSITVTHNGRILPFDVTPLYTDHPSSFDDGYGMSSPVPPSTTSVIHIDVSSISRISGVNPVIRIDGSWNNGLDAQLDVLSCIGYINSTERTGVGYWFEKATSFFTGLFNPDVGASDDFQQDAAQQRDEFDEMNEQLEAVTKPPVEDVHMDIDSYLDPVDNAQVAGVFRSFAGSQLITSMMLISLTLALVGYILFGKR